MKKTIFLVDDDVSTGVIVQAMLEDHYDVSVFGDAESCLMGLDQDFPDLFVLDVELPGVDGYELCRRIRALPCSKFSPVIFLSSHDSPSAILAGYEAGAQDYITKPFDHTVLEQKIDNLLRIKSDRELLLDQAESSEQLASIFMTNLGEYAVLIKYLRSLNECSSYDDVVEATLEVLDRYKFSGIIQVRLPEGDKTVSRQGENWPMEVAVVSHVRDQGRIFEFKTRAVFNYDQITILVTNMPVQDSDACGRIRDNLAIVAESANAKIVALQTLRDKNRLLSEAQYILLVLTVLTDKYGKKYKEAHFNSTLHTEYLVNDLQSIFGPLGLGNDQEDQMLEVIRQRSDELVAYYDFGNEFTDVLASLQEKLGSLLPSNVG
ncbi:MAG: hypothetical protein RIR18_528 [Pseudomonadota bacterium]